MKPSADTSSGRRVAQKKVRVYARLYSGTSFNRVLVGAHTGAMHRERVRAVRATRCVLACHRLSSTDWYRDRVLRDRHWPANMHAGPSHHSALLQREAA